MKNRIIILSIIYGLIFLLAGLLGVVISFSAQPGGISQSNAFIAPFLGPWSQTLRPNPHPVSTWSAEYALFAKSLTIVLVLSLAGSYLTANGWFRHISSGIAVLVVVIWVLDGLVKVVSQLA
ncbi:MAG: hypothetical protein GY845_11610 [Planctomycetes bacterium]|nr:hypothetical protein [Planctomycetota bacterium]